MHAETKVVNDIELPSSQNNLDLDKGGDLRAIRIQQSKKRKRVNDEPVCLTLSSDEEDNDEDDEDDEDDETNGENSGSAADATAVTGNSDEKVSVGEAAGDASERAPGTENAGWFAAKSLVKGIRKPLDHTFLLSFGIRFVGLFQDHG